MASNEELLCPSFKCTTGARLIGIADANGVVTFLGKAVPIDRQFVDIARRGRPPELRFRFAHVCARGSCGNWGANGCGIAAGITRSAGTTMGALPDCGIRSQCRWYHERGADACVACPQMVRGSECR